MQNILTQFTDYSTILPVTIGFVLGGLIIGMIFFLSRQRITFENGEYKKEIEELKTQLSEISDQYHDTKSDLIRTQAQRDSLKDLMESRKEDQKSITITAKGYSSKSNGWTKFGIASNGIEQANDYILNNVSGSNGSTIFSICFLRSIHNL